MATVSPRGDPHVVPVSIGWLDERIYLNAGVDDVKVRNIEANRAVCLHLEAREETGWDSLLIWGSGRVLRSRADRERLWRGVLSYDLDDFDPEGPATETSCFVEVVRKRPLCSCGTGWTARRDGGDEL